MKIKDVRKLHSGDQVYWNDPDDGTCSRVYQIQTIEVDPETGVVVIQEPDGSMLECYARELR
jgi:hypothetical protein